ncbi:MAG: SUMF1/EgtB/PvdO family nonheme iron enzyme [Bacteroidales bacterium]|nr:SUMF1/EgtB/PvdO family nonheme iron enzyme [Bacteroidales bacterium]
MIGSINCYCQESSDKIPIAFDGKTYGYMIRVPGGTFTMGSNDGESDEKPPHSVSVSTFYIGETEVTQELWKDVMGDNPSWFDY